MNVDLQHIFFKNEDVIIREIEGEYLMVPIASGIGDMEDEMYTLNETGIAIWEKLSPERSLENIIDELCEEYDADKKEIINDVIGLIEELFKRKIVLC